MRMVAAWLDDMLRLAVGEYDRLRLSESRLSGGLENVIASLPSEAKLAVPGRCDGGQRRSGQSFSMSENRAIGLD